MLPLGKISQVTRSIMYKSRAGSQVPLTTAFDCASPNSRINNILNQWNYMKEEKNKRKQQIKAERAKRNADNYKINLLPNYSKKMNEKRPTETVAPLNYITTPDNRRISREFFALLRSREHHSLKIDKQRLSELTSTGTTKPPQSAFGHKQSSPTGGHQTNKTKQVEELTPHLAKYLRETMERNDITSKIYGIDFYERTKPQTLKHILDEVSKHGASGLSNEQRAKLDAFLKVASRQSPEEFRRQLLFLKADGFLNKPMLDYFRKLLENSVPDANNQNTIKQLSVLQDVDKIGDSHWGVGSAKSGGQKGAGVLFPFNQHAKVGNGSGSGDYSQHKLENQYSKRWSFLRDHKSPLSDNAHGKRSRGGRVRFANQYSYEYQQNGTGTGRANPYRYGNQNRLRWNKDPNKETVLKIHKYSNDDIFAIDNKNNNNNNNNINSTNRQKNEAKDNKNFQLLKTIRTRLSSQQAKDKSSSSQDKDSDNQNEEKKYVKYSWERSNNELPKRKKIVEPVVEKKRMERYQIPPPKEKKKLEVFDIRMFQEERGKSPVRPSRSLRLNLIPHVKKARVPALPDRNRKASVIAENFSGVGFFGPPNVDKRLLNVILSGKAQRRT